MLMPILLCQIQYNITHRIPYGYLVLAHLAESLVFVPLMIGVLFFLIEFFLDQFLAFLVLSVVWAAEVYSVVRYDFPACTSYRFLSLILFLFPQPSHGNFPALLSSRFLPIFFFMACLLFFFSFRI